VQIFSIICNGIKINESNPTLQETQWGKQRSVIVAPGEVNGRVSAAERTHLHRAFCLAAERQEHPRQHNRRD